MSTLKFRQVDRSRAAARPGRYALSRIRRVRPGHRSISRAIDLSYRACGVGAGFPGRGTFGFTPPTSDLYRLVTKVMSDTDGIIQKVLQSLMCFDYVES